MPTLPTRATFTLAPGMGSIATRLQNATTRPRPIWPGNAPSTGSTSTCVVDFSQYPGNRAPSLYVRYTQGGGVSMKAILLALASFSTTLLVAQDNRIEEIGKSPVVAKVSPGGKVRMDLCSSAIELVG